VIIHNPLFREAALRHSLREATVNCALAIKFPAAPQGALTTQRDSPSPRPDCNSRNLQLAIGALFHHAHRGERDNCAAAAEAVHVWWFRSSFDFAWPLAESAKFL
jgi:hypothetical protein